MPDDRVEIARGGPTTGRLLPGDGGPAVPAPYGAPAESPAPRTPWRAGIATGVGSMPGTDPVDAAALIAGELPDLPHLVELPQRGAGADMIGRTAALLVDMPVEVVPTGWRLSRRPGRDLRRAIDFLAWDVDAAEQHFLGAGWVKIQAVGPWTLAAHLETPSGNRAVLDRGAVDELAASLVEGLTLHLADLSRRLPGTGMVVQIDEPSLPAVLVGTLATASGFGTVPAIEDSRAVEVLAAVGAGLDGRPSIAHCCHPEAPVDLLRRAGFDALSLDVTSLGTGAARLDPIGEAVEAGAVLLAGLVPTREPAAQQAPQAVTGPTGEPAGDQVARPGHGYDFHAVAAPLLELCGRLGLPDSRFAQMVVTPTCGLAGAPPNWARRALALARDAARLLQERAEGG